MPKKQAKHRSSGLPLTSEAARQRWELFHRAIAHAKQSNLALLDDGATPCGDAESTSPLLTIVR
ncbi:MAG: hypothetical protein OEW73_02840 [Gammaproteobacteria bacterium]|nr:hypothetical protein [Gammaproteobacteria bacterium]MDH5239703.1 hypothetical protein [Gammaproteobacteria bacterium]MDH5261561.1 hypothetical protein [Gammaproteobacteria bacterium]MDH5582273.1 hypothetical protein [Gammaproteobacteria bacterium]